MALIVKCNFNAHITSFRSVQDLFCWNLNWLPWQFFWERKTQIFRYYYTHFVHNKKWTWREKLNQARFCVTYFKLSLNCIYLQENRYAWYSSLFRNSSPCRIVRMIISIILQCILILCLYSVKSGIAYD